jgi:hypothetical protein
VLYPLSYEGGLGSLTPRVCRRPLPRWPVWWHGTVMIESRTHTRPHVLISAGEPAGDSQRLLQVNQMDSAMIVLIDRTCCQKAGRCATPSLPSWQDASP